MLMGVCLSSTGLSKAVNLQSEHLESTALREHSEHLNQSHTVRA